MIAFRSSTSTASSFPSTFALTHSSLADIDLKVRATFPPRELVNNASVSECQSRRVVVQAFCIARKRTAHVRYPVCVGAYRSDPVPWQPSFGWHCLAHFGTPEDVLTHPYTNINRQIQKRISCTPPHGLEGHNKIAQWQRLGCEVQRLGCEVQRLGCQVQRLGVSDAAPWVSDAFGPESPRRGPTTWPTPQLRTGRSPQVQM
jgi:hypothetical protein